MLKVTKKNKENDTDRHMFASGLFRKLEADYIALKVLIFLEPLYLAETILPKQIELLEKIFKFYIAIKTPNIKNIDDLIDLGHNLEKLRETCEKFNVIFGDVVLKNLTAPLNDRDGKFFQHLRYGSHKEIKGFSADPGSIMLLIDKFFSG